MAKYPDIPIDHPLVLEMLAAKNDLLRLLDREISPYRRADYAGLTIAQASQRDGEYKKACNACKSRLDDLREQISAVRGINKRIVTAEDILEAEERLEQRAAAIQERARLAAEKQYRAVVVAVERTLDKPTARQIDYYEYVQSRAWQKKSEAAKRRAGYRCQLCNRHKSEVRLNTHHRTYERLGHEIPADLIVLCEDDHAKFHDKLP